MSNVRESVKKALTPESIAFFSGLGYSAADQQLLSNTLAREAQEPGVNAKVFLDAKLAKAKGRQERFAMNTQLEVKRYISQKTGQASAGYSVFLPNQRGSIYLTPSVLTSIEQNLAVLKQLVK